MPYGCHTSGFTGRVPVKILLACPTQATAPGSLGATVPGPSPMGGTTAAGAPVGAPKGVPASAAGSGEGVQAEGSDLRQALSGVVEGALEAVDPGREQVGEVGNKKTNKVVSAEFVLWGGGARPLPDCWSVRRVP